MLQPIDNKLARLEAVSDWTEEPAQAQAEVVKPSTSPEVAVEVPTPQLSLEKVAETQPATAAKPAEEDPWAVVRAITGPDKQASFRLPEEVHSRLKIAVAMLNDSKVSMTHVITKGILDQIDIIEALIEKKKKKT